MKTALLLATLALAACSTTPKLPPLRTVDHLDLQRFMGDWYVIGTIPWFVEKNNVGTMDIYKLRPDGKIDLKLSPEGFKKYDDATAQLWELLQEHKFLYLHDKSPAEEIFKALNMSKKTFKQAVGKLYKEQKIALFKDKIARIDA